MQPYVDSVQELSSVRCLELNYLWRVSLQWSKEELEGTEVKDVSGASAVAVPKLKHDIDDPGFLFLINLI